MEDELLAQLLASGCSRSEVQPEALQRLRAAFPGCRVIRLSFGLQNKVMVTVAVDVAGSGRTHISFVPIHPTAAAAAVLQNNPIVVRRTNNKRSPLWDQEDVLLREACASLCVVSMPFYWPPRQGGTWEGHLLPIPRDPEHHPTFGAMSVAGNEPITQHCMQTLAALALRTGRHVAPHISMLLQSLEASGLLPNEREAQDELRDYKDEDGVGEEEEAEVDRLGLRLPEAEQQLQQTALAPRRLRPWGPHQQAEAEEEEEEERGEEEELDELEEEEQEGKEEEEDQQGLGWVQARGAQGPSASPAGGGTPFGSGASPDTLDPSFPGPWQGPQPGRRGGRHARHVALLQRQLDAARLLLVGCLLLALSPFASCAPALLACATLVPLALLALRVEWAHAHREPLLVAAALAGAAAAAAQGPRLTPPGFERLGILAFLLRACGAGYLLLAPLLLLLQVRPRVAARLQLANLCAAVVALPRAYAATAGGATDPVHVALLVGVLALAAAGGMRLLRAGEALVAARWRAAAAEGEAAARAEAAARVAARAARRENERRWREMVRTMVDADEATSSAGQLWRSSSA